MPEICEDNEELKKKHYLYSEILIAKGYYHFYFNDCLEAASYYKDAKKIIDEDPAYKPLSPYRFQLSIYQAMLYNKIGAYNKGEDLLKELIIEWYYSFTTLSGKKNYSDEKFTACINQFFNILKNEGI